MNTSRKVLMVLLILAFMFSCFPTGVFAEEKSAQQSMKQSKPQPSPTLQITPSRFEILIEPRGKTIQSLAVCNYDKYPINLIAETKDWDLDENNNIILLETQSSKMSAANWIRFNPKKFTVGPGETQYIRFSISVPPNVKPGEYRTALVLTTEQQYEMRDSFYYKPSFAILVYVNIPKIFRAGEISEVKVVTKDVGNCCIEGQLKALGNAHLRVGGEYFLYNSEGKEVKTDIIGKIVVLPEHSTKFLIDLGKDLTPGKYKLKLVWNYISSFYMEGKLDEYPLNQKSLVKEFTFTIQ